MDLLTSYQHVVAWIQMRHARSERGASLIEYALLLAFIAMVCVLAVQFLGTQTNDRFSNVGSMVQHAPN